MKIRADFVTNSSSSSYMVVEMAGEKLMEILDKYKYLLYGMDEGFSLGDDGLVYNSTEEEAPIGNMPETKDEIVASLIEFINGFSTDNPDGETFMDMFCADEELDDPEEGKKNLIRELRENKEEIIETLNYLLWEETIESFDEDDSVSRATYDGEVFSLEEPD